MTSSQVTLTPEQLTILAWLAQGNFIEICSDYCANQGDIYLSAPLEVRVFDKTVRKLLREGLIEFQSVTYFGVRWDKFVITAKGEGRVCG